MQKVGHLDESGLAAFVEGEMTDVGARLHVQACPLCRTRLADLLVVLGGLKATAQELSATAPQDRSSQPLWLCVDHKRPPFNGEKEPEGARHVSRAEFSSFLAQALEGEPAAESFFETARHLLLCNSCFSEFARLFRNLSPQAATVTKIVNSTNARPAEIREGWLRIFENAGRFILLSSKVLLPGRDMVLESRARPAPALSPEGEWRESLEPPEQEVNQERTASGYEKAFRAFNAFVKGLFVVLLVLLFPLLYLIDKAWKLIDKAWKFSTTDYDVATIALSPLTDDPALTLSVFSHQGSRCVKGRLVDKKMGKGIATARVGLEDENGFFVGETETDQDGAFALALDPQGVSLFISRGDHTCRVKLDYLAVDKRQASAIRWRKRNRF